MRNVLLTAIVLSLICAPAEAFVTTGYIFPSPPTKWHEVQLNRRVQITGIEAPSGALPVKQISLLPSIPAQVSVDQYAGVRAGDQIVWTVTVGNRGASVANFPLCLQVSLQAAPGQFWDGYETRPVAAAPLERTAMTATFPATALFWKQHALVLGVVPGSQISSLQAVLDPVRGTYTYGTKISLAPHTGNQVTFVLYTGSSRFGAEGVIQGYYDRYSYFFEPAQDADPRLAGFRGTSGSYGPLYTYNARNEARANLVAAFNTAYVGWDWGYATIKWPGDWYGRPETWNLSVSKGDQAALEQKSKDGLFDLLDINAFHRQRQELYSKNDLRGNVDLAFYICHFGEEELLKQNDWMKYTYPYHESNSANSGHIKGWVTPYDNTWHVYPWATPWEAIFRRDLPDVLTELNTNAFALDVYCDTTIYRGPTTHWLPGWSYDTTGPFINTAVGYRQVVELIHSLHKGRFRAAAVANSGLGERSNGEFSLAGGFVDTMAPDAYLWEGDNTYLLKYRESGNIMPHRYLMGGKMISNAGSGYADKIGEVIPWQNMSPNAIRRAFDKYLRTRLIACWQMGLAPDFHMSRGITSYLHVLPQLLAVESLGWQPCSGSSGDPRLDRRRYGSGFTSKPRLAAIAYSNPTESDIESSETVHTGFIGGGAFLPVRMDGAAMPFTCSAAQTRWQMRVPALETSVLMLPLSLRTSGIALQGSSSAQLAAHQQKYLFTLQVKARCQAMLRFAAPRDFALKTILVNGHPTTPGQIIQMAAGTTRVEVTCNSADFASDEASLRAFPWEKCVLATEGDDPRVAAAAQILRDYVSFYRKTDVPVQAAAGNNEGPVVLIGTGANRGIRLDGRQLRVTGSDGYETQQLAWRLMHLLTDDDPYITIPQWTNPSTQAMLDKIGLVTDTVHHYGKVITPESLQPVPGQDAGGVGGSVDFHEVKPLPREGWKATASHEFTKQGNHSVASNVLDGVAGSFWTPGSPEAGEWLQVDMAAPRQFNQVQLRSSYPYVGYVRRYRLEASDDGQTWRVLAEGAGVKDTDIFLPHVETARYLRVTSLQKSEAWWTMDEFLVFLRTATAQPAAATAPAVVLPSVDVPRAASPVQVDGDLQEPAWARAAVLKDWQSLKVHPLTQPTELRVLHDEQALYFGFVCHEDDMAHMWDAETQRDGALWDGDDVELYLAPSTPAAVPKYPYYQFIVNPAGAMADLRSGDKADVKWNGLWQAAVKKDKDQWRAEVRIPLATIGAVNATELRFNAARLEKPNGELSTWAPMSGVLAQPERFGWLRLK